MKTPDNTPAGYAIIERCTVGDSTFLLGEKTAKECGGADGAPYAVWEYANGAYLHERKASNRNQALVDFGRRIALQAKFLSRHADVQEKRTKPPSGPER